MKLNIQLNNKNSNRNPLSLPHTLETLESHQDLEKSHFKVWGGNRLLIYHAE